MKYIIAFGCLILFVHRTAAQEYGRTDTTFDVLHYDLALRPDVGAKRLEAETRLLVRIKTGGLESVVLDAVGMDIGTVSVGSRAEANVAYDGLKLAIPLGRPMEAGDTVSILVRYSTAPLKGMFFVAPNASFPNRPTQFWTHNQPDDARHWFPCHDVPWDKATFSIEVEAPGNMEVSANGRQIKKKAAKGSKRTWRFALDRPISTYLAAVAGGEFRKMKLHHAGLPHLEGWYRPGTPSDAVEATYGETGEMIQFFERFTGIRYPWPKYVQIPLRDFPYGGMENASVTFLSDIEVLFDKRARADYTDQPLVAHELAHQWWGDLATCRDWEDLWINEGFATYFQQLWTRESEGAEEFDYQRLQGVENILRYLDGDSPLTVRAHTKNAPQNLYSKGAAILSMLSDMIGEGAFKSAVTEMLTTYAYSTITTRQLQESFERISGADLDAFFHQWLDRADYPTVMIEKTWDASASAVHLRVSQRSSSSGAATSFHLPLRFTFGGDTAHTSMSLTTTDTVWTVQLAAEPAFVNVGRFVPMKAGILESHRELIAKVQHARQISERIISAEALVPHINDPRIRTALFDAAKNDAFYGVRFRAATALSRIDPDTAGFAGELRELFIALLDDKRSSVRATALNGLSRFNDRGLEHHFRNALNDRSYHVEAAAMNGLVMLHPPDQAEILQERLRKKSFKNILAGAALDKVAEHKLAGLTDDVRVLAGPGNSLVLRFAAVKTLLRLNPDQGMVLDLCKDMLAEPAVEVRYIALSALVTAVPSKAPELLAEHLKVEQDENLRAIIEQYLSQMKNNPVQPDGK